MTIEELQAIFQSPIRVCKEHRDSFSKECPVCKLEKARNEMLQTFWYVSKCCEQPYSGPPVATQLEPLETILTTNEEAKAMRLTLNLIVEIADTMVDRYGNPDGNIKPWPRPGSKGAP
jgi:hypothetical protein